MMHFLIFCIHVYYFRLYMVYTYKRKHDPIERREIELAIQRINSGESENSVCKALNLPRSTVQRHRKAILSGSILPSPGRTLSLPAVCEEHVATIVREAGANGFGLSRRDLQEFVAHVVKRHLTEDSAVGEHFREHCQFLEGSPSQDWITKFMQRHDLSLYNASTLPRSRVEAASDPSIIYGFYNLLKSALEKLGLEHKPENVFDLDETCFVLDPNSGKVIAAKGSRHVQRVTAGNGKQSFSVLACVSADGASVPPMVIFPGKSKFHLVIFLYNGCG